MTNLHSMLERNKVFAAQQSAAGTLMPSLPRAPSYVKAIIIGCADMRLDLISNQGGKSGIVLTDTLVLIDTFVQ